MSSQDEFLSSCHRYTMFLNLSGSGMKLKVRSLRGAFRGSMSCSGCNPYCHLKSSGLSSFVCVWADTGNLEGNFNNPEISKDTRWKNALISESEATLVYRVSSGQPCCRKNETNQNCCEAQGPWKDLSHFNQPTAVSSHQETGVWHKTVFKMALAHSGHPAFVACISHGPPNCPGTAALSWHFMFWEVSIVS